MGLELSCDISSVTRHEGDIWTMVGGGHAWFVGRSRREVGVFLGDVLNGNVRQVVGVSFGEAVVSELDEVVFWFLSDVPMQFGRSVLGIVYGPGGNGFGRVVFGNGSGGGIGVRHVWQSLSYGVEVEKWRVRDYENGYRRVVVMMD